MTETRSTYEELCRVMCLISREGEEAKEEIERLRERNGGLRHDVGRLEAELSELRCRLDDAERDSGLRRAHERPETPEAHSEAVKGLAETLQKAPGTDRDAFGIGEAP